MQLNEVKNILRNMATATLAGEAEGAAMRLRGADLALAAEILGATVYGTVANKRKMLVAVTIGDAYQSVAMQQLTGADRGAFLSRYAARVLNTIENY